MSWLLERVEDMFSPSAILSLLHFPMFYYPLALDGASLPSISEAISKCGIWTRRLGGISCRNYPAT